MKTKINSLTGFTLIEIMVAVSIFAVVAVMATGALLTANAVNQKAQATKLVTDNLNFAVDSMVFKLRKSSAYYCTTPGSLFPNNLPPYQVGLGCANGNEAIVVSEKGSNNQRRYVFFFREANNLGALKFIDTDTCATPDTCNEDNALLLTSAAVDIENLRFYVSDEGPRRAMITIFGQGRAGKTVTEFALETVAAERR